MANNSCEGLTGLQKVWCQICEYFREVTLRHDEQTADRIAYLEAGKRDDDVGEDARAAFDAWLAGFLDNIDASAELKSMLAASKDLTFPLNILSFFLTQFAWTTAEVTGRLGMFNIPVQQDIAGQLQIARPDPAAAWAMHWRGLPRGEMDRLLKDLGWSPTLISYFSTISRPRLSPADLFRKAYLRGESHDPIGTEMARRGYVAGDITASEVLSQFVPGPGDLVRMAVREAWRDDVAARWGYDQDRPGEFLEWMRRQGDVHGWAEKYWRAHWELPGVTLGMEMLHRVPEFGIDDFKELLRISDIPATFRDYISRIAYRTLTRVDVRRMYGTGVLNAGQVYQEYLNFGYDATNAQRMADFTVAYETDAERDLTKSDILTGYRIGTISRGDALSWLQALRYSADVAELLVLREEAKLAQKYVDEQVKHLKTLYTNSEIGGTEVTIQLHALGLDPAWVQDRLEEWNITRTSKVQRPSRATLDKFFKRDVITQSEYTIGLDNLGYGVDYISWYLDNILEEKAEATRKEEEAARKEQDDVAKRELVSAYQLAKAVIDVDIAELQTAIAETQLAIRTRRLRYDRELSFAQAVLSLVELKEQAKKDEAAYNAEIKVLQTTQAAVTENIANLEADIADIKLRSTPTPKPASPGEIAVAIRAREVSIAELRETIDLAQTEIAAIKLAFVEPPEEFDEEAALVGIAERQLLIETIQDDIAAIVIEIAEIRATSAIVVVELTKEEADVLIKERELAIEIGKTDIAAIKVEITVLRTAITDRKVRLIEDIDLAGRARAVEDVESEFLEDFEVLTVRLGDLRMNVNVLREAKATLTVEYREAIIV